MKDTTGITIDVLSHINFQDLEFPLADSPQHYWYQPDTTSDILGDHLVVHYLLPRS